MSRLVASALVVSVCALSACARSGPGGSSPSPSASTPTVRFLLVNDTYVSDTLRDGSGGLARVAAWRDSVERATNDRVLLLFAGDLLSPSLLSKWYQGVQMVQALNATRADYGTLGNHEFDVDRPQFEARIAESRFRWLSANCRFGDGTPFPGVRGWDTLTVDGTRVGIFGTTVQAEYRSWVACSDANVAARAAVDTLEGLGVDLVVGLTHQFMWHDTATLIHETRVPLLLGGHDHDGRRFARDGRLLIKAASNARTAAYVTATQTNGQWQLDDRLLRPARGWTEQAATAQVTAAWRDTLIRRIGQDRVLGQSAEVIDAVDSTSRSGESRFGNLVADAYRGGTKADVALVNSGALRFDDVMGPGAITAHTIESVFLFADETRVVTFPLTGVRLRELLEHGVSARRLGSGAYPQVSGVVFTVDARRPTGDRIVGALRRPDGSPIAPDATVQVSFTQYPSCLGGDGYTIPEAKPACDALNASPASRPRSADLVLQHLERMQGVIVQPPLGRVTRSDRLKSPE